MDDADDDCNSQAMSSLGSKIRNESLTQKPDTSRYETHISLDSVRPTRECSQTLLTLVGEISRKLQHTLPPAMIGHIVLSTVWGRELVHVKEC